MRVMLVTNGLGYGGAERIVEALALDLRARDFDITVVATTRDGPVGDALRSAQIPVDVLHIRSFLDVRVPWRLARIARRFRPDVVHSHLAVADIAVAASAPLSPRAALISTVHNPGVELSRAKTLLWSAALTRFDRVLAVSEAVAATLPASLPVQLARPSLVSAKPPSVTRAEARARLGIAADTRLVLGVGRLAPVKGFDLLARAAFCLRTPNVCVMVIGEGPERATLEALGGLRFAGPRADAAELIAAADVLVAPSKSEGLPQVPLQAMVFGVPVVATRVGGLPEVVVDGETGILVPPEDPEALATAIDRVLGDSALAARLGAAGRARLREANLTREAMVDRTIAIYRTAVS